MKVVKDLEDPEEIGKILKNYKITLPICNVEVFIQRYGGHYRENGDYIKAYQVVIVLNNFKTDPFDTLYKYLRTQPYGYLGWNPFIGKGVIDFGKLVDGFENAQPLIDDYIDKIAKFK